MIKWDIKYQYAWNNSHTKQLGCLVTAGPKEGYFICKLRTGFISAKMKGIRSLLDNLKIYMYIIIFFTWMPSNYTGMVDREQSSQCNLFLLLVSKGHIYNHKLSIFNQVILFVSSRTLSISIEFWLIGSKLVVSKLFNQHFQSTVGVILFVIIRKVYKFDVHCLIPKIPVLY